MTFENDEEFQKANGAGYHSLGDTGHRDPRHGWENDEEFQKANGAGYTDGVRRVAGKKASELIKEGALTKDTMTKEHEDAIVDEVVRGGVKDKEILSKELELIGDNKELMSSVIEQMYLRAIEQMQEEKRPGYGNTTIDKKFDFLAVVSTLIDNNYDVYDLKIKGNNNEKDTDFLRLMSNFKDNCQKYDAHDIKNPKFDNGKKTFEDSVKETSPYLFTSEVIRDLYVKHPNPEFFQKEYQEYVENKKPGEPVVTFEEAMRYNYGLVVPKPYQNIEEFRNAREKQMLDDKLKRQSQIEKIEIAEIGDEMRLQ